MDTKLLDFAICIIAITIVTMVLWKPYGLKRQIKAALCSCGLFSFAIAFVLIVAMAVIRW